MLSVHRASRADVLAAVLADLLAAAPADPFAADVIGVPTRGVERWLSQTLAARLGTAPDGADGVCANVAFPFPGGIVGDALSRATGVNPADDPWAPERLVWPLIEVAEGAMDAPWLVALARHVGHGTGGDAFPDRRARRFATLRHVADLYDRYAVHRPEMLVAWAEGDDADGNGAPLDHDVVWQAELWRHVRQHIGVPGPAERLPAACAALAAEPDLCDLPSRVALFGLTRLPAMHLDVLDAIAAHRDVHVFLLHPSPALWDAVAAGGLPARTPPRRDDPSARMSRHPLLSSWGRDAREMQVTLARVPARDIPLAVPDAPRTLLGRLQADIRANAALPGGDGRMALEQADRSVQIHACHGRARQVEVVRDAVLHALADDPTMEPRDVLIMCPDVEEFAPLVHSVFDAAGTPDDDRAPDLRVRLADRSLRQTNPVLAVVATLLELAASRVTLSEVLDLMAQGPVARRFGLDDDDLDRSAAWAAHAGVRWGLGSDARRQYGLGEVDANTWRFGLDRLMMGVAVAEDGPDLVDGVLPLDDVGSHDIGLAGRLVELADRLERVLGALTGPHPLGGWTEALRHAADLLTDVARGESWQRAELERILAELDGQITDGAGPDLGLAEVTALLADALAGAPTRANFRTGNLTVCTLVPMRSVPHRMVCVLGLDDGAFPRRGQVDGDDILARDPRVGDQDVRGEDRQLLLDALMAAGECLVVVHTGNDERTNGATPPAVPVLELRDVIDRTARTDDGTPASDAVTVRHPLQPFDPRNFAPGVLGRPGPWGFDPVALDGARALRGVRVPYPPFLDSPLAPADVPAVALDALLGFLGNPVKAFLRQRLGVYVGVGADEARDALPVNLDGLDVWLVSDRVLRACLAGATLDAALGAERRRGHLPPGRLADQAVEKVRRDVGALLTACGPLRDLPSRSVVVEVALHGGRTLAGTVLGLRGDTLLDVNPSRVKPKRRLDAWARLAALTAHDPTRPWDGRIVGRGPSQPDVVALAPLGDTAQARRAAALDALGVLVDMYDRGLREPLPLFAETSAALAVGDDVSARNAWEGNRIVAGERDAPEAVLAFDGALGLDDLLALPPAASEEGAGWDEEASGRAERLAARLWDPLLRHEAGDGGGA